MMGQAVGSEVKNKCFIGNRCFLRKNPLKLGTLAKAHGLGKRIPLLFQKGIVAVMVNGFVQIGLRSGPFQVSPNILGIVFGKFLKQFA